MNRQAERSEVIGVKSLIGSDIDGYSNVLAFAESLFPIVNETFDQMKIGGVAGHVILDFVGVVRSDFEGGGDDVRGGYSGVDAGVEEEGARFAEGGEGGACFVYLVVGEGIDDGCLGGGKWWLWIIVWLWLRLWLMLLLLLLFPQESRLVGDGGFFSMALESVGGEQE